MLICCPEKGAPTSCTWREDKNPGTNDCNGQCRTGEVRAGLEDPNSLNSWGGFPRADGGIGKCGRGGKAFCCMSGMFDRVSKDCNWKKRLVFPDSEDGQVFRL
jgi:chitinase